MSEESKERISESKKGLKLSTEHKKNISDGLKKSYDNYERIPCISDDQKQKISEGLKKHFLENPKYKKEKIKKEKKPHIYTIEEKEKISQLMSGENNSFYGKNHSEETKNKMSKIKQGKYIGGKNPFYGKYHSDESKEKISKSLKEKPKKIYYVYDNKKLITYDTSINLLFFFNLKTVNNICRYCDKNKKFKGYYIKSCILENLSV